MKQFVNKNISKPDIWSRGKKKKTKNIHALYIWFEVFFNPVTPE